MDYIIYDENLREIGREDSQYGALLKGEKWAAGWRWNGCPNPRHFTIFWNGTKPETVYDSRNQGKAT